MTELVRDPLTGQYNFRDPSTAVINRVTGQTANTLKTPGMFSSEAGVSIVNDAKDKEIKLSGAPVPPATTPPPTTTTSNTPAKPTQTSVKLINPETGQEVNFTDASINRSQIQSYLSGGYELAEASGEVPSWLTATGVDTTAPDTDPLADEAAELRSAQERLKNFNVGNDPALIAMLDNISNQWETRISEMERINKSRTAAITTTGIRTGSRYTGGAGGVFGGIISEEERQGLERISTLESQKQQALLEARQAYESNKWTQYSKLVEIAETNYKNQLDAIKELNKVQAEQDAKIKEQIRTSSVDNAIASLFSQGVRDPATVLNYLNYDENGNLIGDVTLKEVDDALSVLEFEDIENKPNSVLEYEYAVSQGYGGSFTEYEREQRTPIETTPSSIREYQYAVSQGYDGSYADFAGGGGKPPTSAQETVASYAARVEQAIPTFDTLADDISKMNLVRYEAEIRLPSAAQSTTIRQYMQASRNFINAVLRRESGAVISPSEFAEARQQYLPQPGDDDATLQEKKVARQLIFETYKRAAGGAYQSVEDLLSGSGVERGAIGANEIVATSPDGTQISFDSLSDDEKQTLIDSGYTFEE